MVLPEFEISDQVALVTGARRGIVAGVARVLAEAGFDVAVNALTPQHLQRLAVEITAGHLEVMAEGLLYFQQEGAIEDYGRLVDLHTLFAETLSRPQKIGAASAQALR